MNRKKLTALLMILVMVLNLVACGAQEEPAAEAVHSETRDTVIIAIGDEPTTLDPTKGWGHGTSQVGYASSPW